jgi:hypothetical protein
MESGGRLCKHFNHPGKAGGWEWLGLKRFHIEITEVTEEMENPHRLDFGMNRNRAAILGL